MNKSSRYIAEHMASRPRDEYDNVFIPSGA